MDTKNKLFEELRELMPGAEETLLEILSRYQITQADDPAPSDLPQLLTKFLAAKRIDGLSPKTLKGYREIIGAFAARMDKPAAEISTDDVRGYIAWLLESKGLAQTSVQTHISTLRSFWGWLELEEIIPRSPMRRIKSLRLDRSRARRPLSPEELERLREGCQDYRQRALVEFMVSTGCRVGEVVGIRLDEIDWTNRSVTVTGKGRKSRTVLFSVRAALMLQTYLQERPGGGGALFTAARAPYNPMTESGLQKLLRQIGDNAKSDRHVHPHLLRHTFASNALNGGMDVATIQHLMGHEDPKTTMIYAKLRPEAVKQAYDRVVA